MGPIRPRSLLRLALPCDLGAPRAAREAMRDVVEIAAVRDDALLVVSELVTNAVTHSGCQPPETIALHAVLTGDCLRITVRDPGHSVEVPAIPAKERPHGGGLGLRLVAQIARRWGVERPPGLVVWAELAV